MSRGSNAERVYVVVRVDGVPPGSDPGLALTVVEVLPDEHEASVEVDRLNALNRDKGAKYSFQAARWYPAGRSVAGDGSR